jgi:hypothetical protein
MVRISLLLLKEVIFSDHIERSGSVDDCRNSIGKGADKNFVDSLGNS